LEVDFAEREEWYSQNTSTVLNPFQPSTSSQYNAQKPKVSVRWQPLDPKYIGALILRGSYSEAFHAPQLFEMTPAGTQTFESVIDPFSRLTSSQVQFLFGGNPMLQPETAYEWSYGIVYSPKWLKGLTVSADWWHIDLRSIILNLVGPQDIIASNPPPAPPAVQNGPLVFRAPSGIPGVVGPITSVIGPNLNFPGAIGEGLDYEATYNLESSMFGHGEFGRLTATVNGTWLSRIQLFKRFGLAGLYFSGNGFPWNRANFSLYYDGPPDTWMQGLDAGAVVHWIGQYEDDNITLTTSVPPFNGPKAQTPRTDPLTGNDSIRARKIAAWTTLDLILNYTFNLPSPAPAPVPGLAKDGGKNVRGKDSKEKNVVPVSTAEYNPCGWRAWLNNTTISL